MVISFIFTFLGRCLDIPVYEKGYKCDAADIAFDAIREGPMRKTDVILIDTAGRMQDNEPLMRSLARLVKLNNPDLILFIGEALVGNDGLDQLMKFNKALIDLSDKDNIRYQIFLFLEKSMGSFYLNSTQQMIKWVRL